MGEMITWCANHPGYSVAFEADESSPRLVYITMRKNGVSYTRAQHAHFVDLFDTMDILENLRGKLDEYEKER